LEIESYPGVLHRLALPPLFPAFWSLFFPCQARTRSVLAFWVSSWHLGWVLCIGGLLTDTYPGALKFFYITCSLGPCSTSPPRLIYTGSFPEHQSVRTAPRFLVLLFFFSVNPFCLEHFPVLCPGSGRRGALGPDLLVTPFPRIFLLLLIWNCALELSWLFSLLEKRTFAFPDTFFPLYLVVPSSAPHTLLHRDSSQCGRIPIPFFVGTLTSRDWDKAFFS